ncbi:MAG: hypothetical protein EBX99_08560 [Acidimicrobiia bacterium]|jgi:hypothetical protein|nr:hypothetical protein [Actinomycetota bacterium]NDB05850.1 hypothetical protein [Acidimicrobiia bacterium]NDA76447.1 hypothetical protein [Actinomycetota bacterium]NDD97489.1 hypothetical protein [Actinomycetota bacterium]NDE59188.1 hypothetical protein [Acidimicrobiia bacterium]
MSVDTKHLALSRGDSTDRQAVIDLYLETAFADVIRLPTPRELSPYVGLSLDFYFEDPSTEITVVSCDGKVVGYSIFCTDPEAMNRWLARRSLRVFIVVMRMLLSGRLSRIGWGFYFRRTLDTFLIMRGRRRGESGGLPHAHMNVREGFRTGAVALLLLNGIDDQCRRYGATAWLGEINGTENTRRRAVERLLGEVIDVRRNITHSWLTGRTVNRISVRRTLS